MAAKLNQKLDEAQREELTRRALAAETPKNLAAEFSVTPAYVAVLKARGVAKLREENGGVLPDESSFQTGNRRLTKAQREEVTRRVLAGEKSPGLAREFGVSRAYVSLLKNMALKPEQFSSHEKLTKKLTVGVRCATCTKTFQKKPKQALDWRNRDPICSEARVISIWPPTASETTSHQPTLRRVRQRSGLRCVLSIAHLPANRATRVRNGAGRLRETLRSR